MKSDALPEFFQYLHQQMRDVTSDLQRIFHGRGRLYPGLEQLTVDWLGQHLVVSLFKPVDASFMQDLKHGLVALSDSPIWQLSQGKSIGLAHRYEHGAPYEVLVGEYQSQVIGEEAGLSYELRLGVAQNAGLFLDMANGRQWVRQHSKDKRVLNLFAYTCGFSVAAIAGGAAHVVNVDMAKSALARGRDNHRLNEHDLRKVTFMGHDILKSWGKITKAGGYDLIVIDPPSFQKGSFALTKDYHKILRRLPSLMNPQAKVLACVNSPAVSQDFLIQAMQEQVPELTFSHRLDNPEVFADIDIQASLKALVFEYETRESVNG